MTASEERIVHGANPWLVMLIGFCLICLGITLFIFPPVKDKYLQSYILISVGALAIGMRNGVLINFKDRTISHYNGIYFWIRSTPVEIGTWQHVDIGPIEHRVVGTTNGKDATVPEVPVSIVGSDKNFKLKACENRTRARRFAERMAKAAGLSLIDRSGEEQVLRSVIMLDMPLIERITEEDLHVIQPVPCRFRISEDGLTTKIRMGFSSYAFFLGMSLVPFAFIEVLWFFIWLTGLGDNAKPDLATTIFMYSPMIILALSMLVAFIVLIHKGAFGHTILVKENKNIHILGKKLGVAEIEEMRIEGKLARHLLIISDRKWIAIGHGLSEDELNYLRAVILKGLTGKR